MNRDWVEKDFYQVLGVSPEATPEEIKRAYRKLAQQLHPDANPGDSGAEERFKEISEAYATLSDTEGRKEYDQVRRFASTGAFAGGGPGGFGGFGGGQQVRVEDLSDLLGGMGGFGDLFGSSRGRGGQGTAPRRGSDTAADLTISFDEAVKGVTTTIQIRGQVACSHCGGSGAEPPSRPLTCPTCGGSGSVAQNQGVFSFAQTCPQCRGAGIVVEDPCRECRGSGLETRTRSIKVRIPAGVKDGATIKLAGKGGPGRNGGPPGDLLVKVHVSAHPVFGRSGSNLTVTVPITFTEAVLGAKVNVPTLDGSVTVKIPPGTTSGKVLRVRGRGVDPERGRKGDLLAKVEIQVPSKVSKDERKLLEQLTAHETEDVRAHFNPLLT